MYSFLFRFLLFLSFTFPPLSVSLIYSCNSIHSPPPPLPAPLSTIGLFVPSLLYLPLSLFTFQPFSISLIFQCYFLYPSLFLSTIIYRPGTCALISLPNLPLSLLIFLLSLLFAFFFFKQALYFFLLIDDIPKKKKVSHSYALD